MTVLALCLFHVLSEMFKLTRWVKQSESEEKAIEIVKSRGHLVPLWATLVGVGGVFCGLVRVG